MRYVDRRRATTNSTPCSGFLLTPAEQFEAIISLVAPCRWPGTEWNRCHCMAFAGPHAGWARSGRQHSGSGSNWAIYSRLGQDPVRKHVVSGHLAPRHQLISHIWYNARTYVNITQWRFRRVVRICNLWEITLETFSGPLYAPGGWIIHLHIAGELALYVLDFFKVNANTLQWNLSVTTTSIMKFITCDLFSNVL